MPLTNAEKANVMIYQYAKQYDYLLDLNNHSRGGLTASVALQYANQHGLTDIPIRDSRFYGTATYVPAYVQQLEQNGFTYNINGEEYKSKASSAVHQSDFVGRPSLLLGGNESTGGSCWFCYSHSSYYMERPDKYLFDEKGNYIDVNGNRVDKPVDNPYYEDFKNIWTGGDKSSINPSIPKLIVPK
ncbi:hypothetical protein [Stenoxybacter acetivorans]|uniref:hypothetical protein n=1 Tax=Stenoxybacter acetivorans TaxID=422441 RepID=UPI00068D6C0D|nr:hypothetical protein [Stenoxybacter acetivorans]